MVRIPFEELHARIEGILVQLGLEERAVLASRLIAETDRDGVRTHGIARLPRFAEMVRAGRIDASARPESIASFGALERWTGHRGPGNLAAQAAMNRAMELARAYMASALLPRPTPRTGCAVEATAGRPPMQGSLRCAGPTPCPTCLPGERRLRRSVTTRSCSRCRGATRAGESAPIVLDIAMSQFSYGTLAAYRERGELLPFPGGFDERGELTHDPAAIERTQRALPIGLWKGSGLAFVLDVLAAMLSDGRATHEIPADALQEVGQSQIFIALAPSALSSIEELDRIAAGAIDFLHAATPIEPGRIARYPGEGTLRIREESMRLGVAVDDTAWDALLNLESES